MAGDLDPKLVQLGATFGTLAAALGPLLVGGGIIVAAAGGPALAITAAIAGLTAAAVAFYPEIKSAIGAVKEFSQRPRADVEALPQKIIDAFANLPEQLAQIGRDIMSGLRDGLKGKFADVQDGLTGCASGLGQWVRDAVRSNSPSEEFREIGQDIMAGLQIDLEDTGRKVQSALAGIFEGIDQQVSGMVKGILTGTQTLRDGVASIVGGLGDRMIGSAMDTLFGAIPGFAMGTNFAPGGLARVGEHGPEVAARLTGGAEPSEAGRGRRRRAHERRQQRQPARVCGANGRQCLGTGDAAVRSASPGPLRADQERPEAAGVILPARAIKGFLEQVIDQLGAPLRPDDRCIGVVHRFVGICFPSNSVHVSHEILSRALRHRMHEVSD